MEITDDMLSRIDLTDGFVEEWSEILGEPTLTPLDFSLWHRADEAAPEYDPADLDFRVWLGWHGALDRMYVAGVFVDDDYVTGLPFTPSFRLIGNSMIWSTCVSTAITAEDYTPQTLLS